MDISPLRSDSRSELNYFSESGENTVSSPSINRKHFAFVCGHKEESLPPQNLPTVILIPKVHKTYIRVNVSYRVNYRLHLVQIFVDNIDYVVI